MLLALARPLRAVPRVLLGPLGICEMSQRAQRIIEAARKVPLPEGTYSVGLGLMISGLTAYGFQILAFKALDKPVNKLVEIVKAASSAPQAAREVR